MKINHVVAACFLIIGAVGPSVALARDEPAKVVPTESTAEKRPEASATEPRAKESLKWDQLDPAAAERAAEKKRAQRSFPPLVPADK